MTKVIFLFSLKLNAEDDCLKWFERTGILNTSPQCELNCAMSPTDMATFTCPTSCRAFCKKSKTKCQVEGNWKLKIKSGVPPKWHGEEASTLTISEKEKLESVLAKLPDSYPINSLQGIYKLQESRYLFSLSTPSTYSEKSIVLYQKAFSGDYDLTQLIVHELGHHLHESDLKKQFESYKKALGWTGGKIRPGEFINQDSKEEPEEDFAKNFESYILNPKILKDKVPLAFQWMSSNLKNKYALKECGK